MATHLEHGELHGSTCCGRSCQGLSVVHFDRHGAVTCKTCLNSWWFKYRKRALTSNDCRSLEGMDVQFWLAIDLPDAGRTALLGQLQLEIWESWRKFTRQPRMLRRLGCSVRAWNAQLRVRSHPPKFVLVPPVERPENASPGVVET